MDLLPQVHSLVDIVKNQVFISNKVFDCSDFRCIVRRSTMIEPNTEVIVPVIVQKR